MSPSEVTLRELLRTIAEKHFDDEYELNVTSISSGGANYTSALFVATFTATNKTDLQLFAKVAILGDKMRELMNATKMFSIEAFFYNELVKTYTDIQDKHGVVGENRYVTPKFYGCNKKYGEETVVLENLAARNYGGYNRFKSLDYEHAASAVGELAKFHALSFAYQKEQPEDFARVTKYLWFHKPVSQAKDEYFPEMTARALKSISNDDHKQRVKKFMEGRCDEMYEKFNRPFGNPVIIHGDFRASNLFFKKEVSSSSSFIVSMKFNLATSMVQWLARRFSWSRHLTSRVRFPPGSMDYNVCGTIDVSDLINLSA